MSAATNAQRIRDGYAAFNAGDVPALIDLFADDIVWHFPGNSKLGGEHVGRDAVLQVLGEYGAACGGTLVANVVDVMASDDRVTGLGRDTPTANGRTLDVDSVVVFTMRDGHVTNALHLFGDQAAVDAFLS